jgi:hypothetical protein
VTISDPAQQLTDRPWRDRTRRRANRVNALNAAMTMREKVARLHGFWVSTDPHGTGVKPAAIVRTFSDTRRTAALTRTGPSLVLDSTRERHCRVSMRSLR